jgi:hypothetical protein
MITGQPIYSLGEVRSKAELQVVVGFLGRDVIPEDGDLTIRSRFPVTPRQFAMGRIEQHDAENGAELPARDQAGELVLLSVFALLSSRRGYFLSVAINDRGSALPNEVERLIREDGIRTIDEAAGVPLRKEVRHLMKALRDIVDDESHDSALSGSVWRWRGEDFGRRERKEDGSIGEERQLLGGLRAGRACF